MKEQPSILIFIKLSDCQNHKVDPQNQNRTGPDPPPPLLCSKSCISKRVKQEHFGWYHAADITVTSQDQNQNSPLWDLRDHLIQILQVLTVVDLFSPAFRRRL